METLKINYILYSMVKTGGQIAPLNFAKKLSEMGHEVSITTGHQENWFDLGDVEVRSLSSSYYKYFQVATKHLVPRIGMNPTKLHLDFLSKLNNIIPEVDVNIATFALTAYLALWNKNKGIPLYHMQHFETLFSTHPEMRALIRGSYHLPVEKIANSTWLQKRIKELTGFEPPIARHAIDHSIFYPRERKNKDDSYVDIVALGKSGFKRSEDVVKAVTKANKKLNGKKRLRLHLYGLRKPNGIDIDNRTIFFHQNISDNELAELYSDSDVEITYSVAESFPLPPLEAMACGTSVITTPYGLEDYAVDGHNSLWVEPGNIEELTKAIETLALDPDLRDSLAKNGIETSKKYDFNITAPHFEQLIKNSMNSWMEREEKINESFGKYALPPW